MNTLSGISVTACACCIACSVLSLLFPDGVMKKTLNLVMGAFLICSMLIPIIGSVQTMSFDYESDTESVSVDEDYSRIYEEEVLTQTAKNLVIVANDLLKSEGITPENIEVGIKKSDNNSIYISTIHIYINETDADKTENIKRIIERNMSKEPVVIVNE